MGTVIQLKNQISNSYSDLKNSVEDKLILVEEKINSKLLSKVDLVNKMSDYHLKTGGKRLRALLTLESAKLCEYKKGGRDINLAACVELIHAATLMHDDVIDNSEIRRGKKTINTIWGNQSSNLFFPQSVHGVRFYQGRYLTGLCLLQRMSQTLSIKLVPETS